MFMFLFVMLLRDIVCLHILDQLKDNVIGGPGLTVEIDESMFGSVFFWFSDENKPAVQAAGADPSRCNSTNRQNSTLQQNCIFWINDAIFMSLRDLQSSDILSILWL